MTNTRASGKLSIEDIYESYDLIAGSKMNNESLIPNFGTTIGLSYTPSHSERHLYRWNKVWEIYLFILMMNMK